MIGGGHPLLGKNLADTDPPYESTVLLRSRQRCL